MQPWPLTRLRAGGLASVERARQPQWQHQLVPRQQQQQQARSRRRARVAATLAPHQQQQQQPGAAASTAPGVTLFYRTNWASGKLHGSLAGGPWTDFPLEKVTSAPGRWLVARLPVRPGASSSPGPLLDFVVTDGAAAWDKPPEGGNYSISAPGTYTLRRGSLAQLPAGPPPVMVVSDLDGTMVGDDAATGEFKNWWEGEGVLRGGLLVYNTGRSLDSFKQLLSAKAGCLAHPDVLISAVGTKIYNFSHSKGWQEDRGWVAQLDAGWEVGAVRDAAYAALAQVGKQSMHFRPPEEQNDHKVTCGVSTAALDTVLASIRGALRAARVEANIITSGTGDWRFLDLVPQRAGKLEALEYVRKAHGFPLQATVACGDSGNDILMLSGKNLAIVVGNAQPDLVTWLQQQPGGGGEAGPIPGKARLLQTRAHEARGILEGLAHWGFRS